MPSEPHLICLSTADWDAPLWTNKQHLMQRLAGLGAKIVYIDSLGLRTPTVSSQDTSRIVRRLKAWRPFARPVARGILRDSPLVLPFHGNAAAVRLNRQLLRFRVRRNEARFRLRRPLMWTYTPTAVDVYDPKRHAGLVYHCVDDLAAYPGVDREAFEANERRLVELATVCIASSRPLEQHLRDLGAREVVYWPNPADTAAYSAARRAPRAGERPVIGFIGAVAEHKVDVELIRAVADLRPDWDWRLVGPVGLGIAGSTLDTESFPPNVQFTGARHRDELPTVVAEFDVAAVPYAINDYTRGVFPMKVFEYLAAGVPVVSTPLPSLVGEVEQVAFASDAAAWVAAIEGALHEDAPELRDARSQYASQHSWEHRAEEAGALVARLGGGR
jgi:glycosyltransferase involved in cell wall biosynthesis